MFLFNIVKSGNFHVFQQLFQVIGNDLSIRDDNDQYLIARICGRRMSQKLNYVMALPTCHGIERGDVDSVVTEMLTSDFREPITIIAAFPRVDLDASLLSKRAPLVIAAASTRSLSSSTSRMLSRTSAQARVGHCSSSSLTGPTAAPGCRLNINTTNLVRNTAFHWCLIVHHHGTRTNSYAETWVMCKML
jgi:hypothetical protein